MHRRKGPKASTGHRARVEPRIQRGLAEPCTTCSQVLPCMTGIAQHRSFAYLPCLLENVHSMRHGLLLGCEHRITNYARHDAGICLGFCVRVAQQEYHPGVSRRQDPHERYGRRRMHYSAHSPWFNEAIGPAENTHCDLLPGWLRILLPISTSLLLWTAIWIAINSQL